IQQPAEWAGGLRQRLEVGRGPASSVFGALGLEMPLLEVCREISLGVKVVEVIYWLSIPGLNYSGEAELKLRNYEPEDEELKKRKVPQAKPASVEDKVKDQLEAAKPEPIIEEVDLANLAPRKPDWDLKRDVAKKLEKLEKRTQRAIAELIRERLKGQEEELASAVGSAKQEGSDSD
ncbi:PREDICTED: coiled-coil domain-containing protein 12, partial [Tauraco erythrolophus]|uniref:coiled-coil domain-containing protein 12 n=1 Tax=Tauraco erythrolophus TaxID=121530 RepID=UPI0005234D49